MKVLSENSAELLILVFLIVTFLQSGIDKITDWRGNISFIKGHFKDSPLKNLVPFLLRIIVITELAASLFMIIGAYEIFLRGVSYFALLGLQLSAVTLIFLLIGQRLAKDYQGAMTLAVYFIVTVLGIMSLHQ
ncbi:MAG: DoxX family protein [Gammaproteobacteria bacterium]|nr:DoxX family protein [Gammaproteobacteria bacterium]|tara:strand:+ start:320 stop:718 length:399 start_codon:yes stop_codon:yes gene_type:complete